MEDTRNNLPLALLTELLARALEFADAGRAVILNAWNGGYTVERKRDGSFVTDADLAVERKLRDLIAAHFPEHGVLGEEFPATRPDADFQWILDPIDGTEDFVHRVATFGSILAVHYRGAPSSECSTIQRSGCAAMPRTGRVRIETTNGSHSQMCHRGFRPKKYAS